MCRQLVSLGDNSILGKCPVSTGSGAKFQTLHMTDLMMDQFPHFLPPASSFPCWPISVFLKRLTYFLAKMTLITVAHWLFSKMQLISWFRVSLYVSLYISLYEGHMSSLWGFCQQRMWWLRVGPRGKRKREDCLENTLIRYPSNISWEAVLFQHSVQSKGIQCMVLELKK